MPKPFNTVAFRLAAGYGVLVIVAVALISALLYWGTVGVLDREINAKLLSVSGQLVKYGAGGDTKPLADEIHQLLTDGIDQDTEEYLLIGAGGNKISGNLAVSPVSNLPTGKIVDQIVTRNDRPSPSRLFIVDLTDGSKLAVGRDLQDRQEIKALILRSLLAGGIGSILVATVGAVLFRRQLEHRIGMIRHTVLEIEAGDLSRRIPVSDSADEFSRLNQELNHLLDQIQRLMLGVQDVSNGIAHDLRTPLGRIRNLLEESLRPGTSREKLTERASTAIDAIDELIIVFDKLLQIAEAEAGARRQSFQAVALREIVTDVAELYDASAEEKGVHLHVVVTGEPAAIGDKELLASATANLVDNALKYAGDGAEVKLKAVKEEGSVAIIVQDNGPGIPQEERQKVLTRFYRVDRSRSLPGNGLGLSIVKAICQLHGGTLTLGDALPGLIARMNLPAADMKTLPNANLITVGKIDTPINTTPLGTTKSLAETVKYAWFTNSSASCDRVSGVNRPAVALSRGGDFRIRDRF